MRKGMLFLVVAMLGAAPVSKFGPNNYLEWDPVTADVAGNAEQIVLYEIACTNLNVDLRVQAENTIGVFFMHPVPASSVQLAVSAIAAKLQAAGGTGNAYRFFARAVDEAGNISAWSDPWEGVLDTVKPTRPTGFGCRLFK